MFSHGPIVDQKKKSRTCKQDKSAGGQYQEFYAVKGGFINCTETNQWRNEWFILFTNIIKILCVNLSSCTSYKSKTKGRQTQELTRGHSDERTLEPSPRIWESLWKKVRKSLLLKGGQAECDYMPDPGQISKRFPHFHRSSTEKNKK